MKLSTLLANPLLLWEAIGIDGITYPFETSRFNKTEAEKAAIVSKVNSVDNAQSSEIARLIEAEDDEALGALIREQVIAYAATLPEAGQ